MGKSNEEMFEEAFMRMFHPEELKNNQQKDSIDESAANLKNLFDSYIQHGFSRKEALYLVGELLKGAICRGDRE